jgi:hypothetical protein
MWDILFNHDITTPTGSTGCAGVCYFNGEIWVSKWASDTLMRFTPAGALIEKFFIGGLTGVRSLTTDGTYLYAGPNSTTIYRIDPVSKTLAPPHITVADNARWITFDQSLNSNAGGFWYGNFGTDINAVSMTGTVLTTIPAATHGLLGMYGAAYDGVSPGGPYLWIFDQGGTNTCDIVALNLPAGTPSAYMHDAFTDVGVGLSMASGLAGGLSLSTTISSGNIALMGIIQGTPNALFAYDLDIPGGSSLEESNMENEISVFPNPSAGQFTITLPASFDNSATVKVFETTGRLLDVFSVSNIGTSAQIDLSAYPEGLYFLQIQSANGNTTEKIMISR